MGGSSRAKVVQAAVRVFAEKGYYEASMDEIAAEAQVAKGTLYYHFDSKAELFKAVVRDGLQWLKDRIDADLRSPWTLEQLVSRLIAHSLDLVAESRGLAHLVLHERAAGMEEQTIAEIREMRDGYVTYMAGILENGKRHGIVRVSDCRLAASALIGLLDSCSRFWLSSDGSVSRQEVESFLYTAITAGLVAVGRSDSRE